MSAWSDFYRGRVGDSYTDYFRVRYAPFLELIQENVGNLNGEFGCGIGTVTKSLESRLGEYHLMDSDAEMLALARCNLDNNLDGILLLQQDITTTSPQCRYDLCYSHGVLEHFSPEIVREIIRRQMACSRILIHYVPSHRYVVPSFGDERLETRGYWEQFGCEVREFNDGYDYTLVWS